MSTKTKGAPQRLVSWGEGLMVKAVKAPGGLNQTVEHIRSTIGPNVGTRNSFAKLYRVEDPATLAAADLWRGWLLLVAVGEEPVDWGIADDVVPLIFREKSDELKTLLRSPLSDSNRRPTLYNSDDLTLDSFRVRRRDRPRQRTDRRAPGGRAA